MAKALFLDRDGVVNVEKNNSYVFHPKEFIFYEGAKEALVAIKNSFDYIIIVTNQRGIGRGLMSENMLNKVHDYMIREIGILGVCIDKVYFSPYLEDEHPYRKPNIGMGLAALQDFPDIEVKDSVMIGNNLSDMQFGKSLGTQTVFLHTTLPPLEMPHPLVNEQYPSLWAWSEKYIAKT